MPHYSEKKKKKKSQSKLFTLLHTNYNKISVGGVSLFS